MVAASVPPHLFVAGGKRGGGPMLGYGWNVCAGVWGALLIVSTAAVSPPTNPVYFGSIADAVTGDNQFTSGGQRYWDVDPAADAYDLERYERPTIQTYQTVGGRYASRQYFEYL